MPDRLQKYVVVGTQGFEHVPAESDGVLTKRTDAAIAVTIMTTAILLATKLADAQFARFRRI